MKNYLAKAKAKLKNSKGFTMIELIIVIAIIVILAAIAVPTFAGFIDNANKTSATSEARNVYMALKIIAVENEIDGTAYDATAAATEAKIDAAVTTGTVTISSFTSEADIDFTYNDGKYTVTYEDGVQTTCEKTP
ncbi:MAG: prepilin-type N-terminal cleavage/methylation domain-containing protein [Clostridia bacterium]